MILDMTTDPDFDGLFVPEWTFGDKVRKVRRELKLTQADFAGRLGVKENTYNAWETGRNTPNLKDAQQVAKRLRLMCGIPEWWILGLEPQNPRPGSPDGGTSAPSRARTEDLRIKSP
jgi:DNA-binding XRE family transcriptional regulator